MADEDWGLAAELQEKCVVKEEKIDSRAEAIPPPVPPENVPQPVAPFRERAVPEPRAADTSSFDPFEEAKDQVVDRINPDNPVDFTLSLEDFDIRPELLKGVRATGSNSKFEALLLRTLLADPPQNMIAQTRSPTRKTASFILAALNGVDTSLNYPQVLVLTPTPLLSLQVGRVARRLAQFIPNMDFCFAVTGEPLDTGSKIGAQFVIGTPDKVLDRAVKFRFFDLRKIRIFVLDEADRMTSTPGYRDQCLRVEKQLTKTCQRVVFSRTYSEDVAQFAEQVVPDSVIIKLKGKEGSPEGVEHYYVACRSEDDKCEAMSDVYSFLSNARTVVAFCSTERAASRLVEKMRKKGHAVALLSGDLPLEQQVGVLERFHEGKQRLLITTHLFDMYIDSGYVTVAVNFDLPTVGSPGAGCCESDIDRVARVAIHFVDCTDALSVLKETERRLGKKILKLN